MTRVPLKYLVHLNPEVLPEDAPADFEFDYIDIASVSRDEGITQVERIAFGNAPSRARRVVRANDVIVSTVRTYLRAVASVPVALDGQVCSTGFAVLRATDAVNPRYLNYAVTAPRFVDEVVSRSTGVSYPGINAADLVRITIPAPSMDEQRAIADFLDRECARITALVGELRRVAQVAVEATLGVVSQELASRPLVRVGHRFDVQLGKMLDESRIEPGETLPYLRNANVYWDRFDLTDLKEMTFSPKDRRMYRVLPGDLLVCEGRHVGRSAVWTGEISEIYFQKALHRVRPRGRDSTRLLMWCLRLMHDRGDFYADGTGSTIPHLPAERLRAARVPWPAINEQESILDRVDASARVGRELDAHANETAHLLEEYRDALITESITGMLDVRKLGDQRLEENADAVRQGEQPELLAR